MIHSLTQLMFSRQALAILPALLIIAWLVIGSPLTPWGNEPIVNSRVLIGAVAVILVGLAALSPTFRPISPTHRTILSALRLGVVILLVVFMLRPTCISKHHTKQTASLLILFDQSRSMTLPHTSTQQTRWQAQQDVLNANRAVLRDIAKELDVKIFAYDSELVEVKMEDGKIAFPLAADGEFTDIGSPLFDAVMNERSSRLAGVILLGDGVQTVTGDSPRVETWQVAEELSRIGQPLHTVAFGPPGSTSAARDLAMVNLPDQYDVYVKNEFTVEGSLQIRGFQDIEIPVQLIVEDSSGKSEIVDTTRVRAKASDEQVNVQLAYQPQKTGQYRLTVRAVPQENETVLKNNELSAFLTVRGGGLRVLFLEGELRAEQKFLRQSIDGSKDIDLDFQWIDHSRKERWPVDLVRALGDEEIDVVILGDLDSRALFERERQEENFKTLIKAVDEGRGLLMLGGYHSFGPGLYGNTPLADVLPIEIDRFEAQDFDNPIRDDLHFDRELRMLPTTRSFITRLGTNAENDTIWRALPALDGANRFRGVNPRARVLAKSEDGVPLLVSGEYGQGRVLAFAGDSTWRWWLQGHEDVHRRFWRQVILWLAKRDEEMDDEVWVKLSRRRFDPGGRVEFNAGANSAAGDVLTDASFEAVAVLPDGTRKPILLTRTGDHQEGRFDDTRLPGTYTIEVTARADGSALGTAKAKFLIYDRDIELSVTEANHEHLARLARQTGGEPLSPSELAELLAEIKNRPPLAMIEIPKKWQLGDTWQDAWFFFLLLIWLLSIEWVLRKKWGLV